MQGWMKWAIALLVGFAIVYGGWRLGDSRWFSWVLPTFFVLNCLVLVVVVLLQSGKAADLAGAFGGAGSQTAFGPRGAATVLSQATTWCAVMFMVCAMALALRSERSAGAGNSVIYDSSKPASKAPATTPAAPAGTQPATTQSSPANSQQNPAPASPAQAPKKQ
jgi:preprotein translocase subunit SecG